MGQLGVVQNKKIEEIKKWASENGNQISYALFLDILTEGTPSFAKDEVTIGQVVRALADQGILVVPFDEGEDYAAQGLETNQFIPALVNIKQETCTISNLMDRLENQEINLKPVFQRKKNLWDDVKQSRLIESLMLRIPVPSFYFDAATEGEWKVIDGLQRLCSIQNYLVGEPKKKLTGLQYLTEFEGYTFDKLPRQYIRRIKEAQVVAYSVQYGTPEAVVYNIFQRINTGGLTLTPQEIRNAMYHGKATTLAQELADSPAFLEATLYAVKPDRMMDQEYIIRFMAFTELDYHTEYKDDIDAFLVLAMKRVNDYEEAQLSRIKKNFYKVMEYTKEIFGRLAFRKINEEGRRGPINKALFELFSVCFAELEESQLNRLLDNREKFLKKYEELFHEREFVSAIKSGKKSDCIRRINRGRELIKEFL